MDTLKQKFINVIKTTNNPLAPIILQEAYSSIGQLGKMLSTASNQATVTTITDRLLRDFPDQEINDLCSTPEFLMSLSGLLAQALLSYSRSL